MGLAQAEVSLSVDGMRENNAIINKGSPLPCRPPDPTHHINSNNALIAAHSRLVEGMALGVGEASKQQLVISSSRW